MNTEHTELMVVGQHGKAGRPTKYSPETVDRLLAGLADGLPIKSACITAGIGVSTLSDWREKYPELEVRMEEAREVARLKMLQRIKRAAEHDWRAAAEWLRLTFPQDYRRASTPTTSTTNITSQTLVLSPEQQQKIREQRRRILATTKGGTALMEADATPAPEPEQPISTRVQPQGLLVRSSSAAEAEPEPEQPEQSQESLKEVSEAIEPGREQPAPPQQSTWAAEALKAADIPRNTEDVAEDDVNGLPRLR